MIDSNMTMRKFNMNDLEEEDTTEKRDQIVGAQDSQNAFGSNGSPGNEMKREKRKVRDKTISYSLTHKGIQPTS